MGEPVPPLAESKVTLAMPELYTAEIVIPSPTKLISVATPTKVLVSPRPVETPTFSGDASKMTVPTPEVESNSVLTVAPTPDLKSKLVASPE